MMEDLDVKTDSLNAGLENSYSSSLDQNKVDDYMQKLQDTQANELDGGMGMVKGGEIDQKVDEDVKEQDDLMARLQNLQN